MTTYRYEVRGTAANDQTWETSGTLYDAPGNFPSVLNGAMLQTFRQLTEGKPGIGCNGPYAVTRIVVEVVPQ